MNFGNSGTEEQQDESSISNTPRRHHQGSRLSSPSRLRSYSHQTPQDRDIYGAESQWSTKLSQSSFQPLNQLQREGDNGKSLESTELKVQEPEIITAQPEDPFVTILVSSDDKLNDTKEINSEEVSTESLDFGQRMAIEEVTSSTEIMNETTQPPVRRVSKKYIF